MRNILITSLLLLLFSSCIFLPSFVPKNVEIISKDDYEYQFIGKTLLFIETPERSKKNYKYDYWMNSNWIKMSYEKLVGKSGKLDWIKFNKSTTSFYYRWYKVTLEDGTEIYNWRTSSKDHPFDDKLKYKTYNHGFIEKCIVLDEYEEIKSRYIKKYLWIKNSKTFSVISPNPLENKDIFSHLSKVSVLDVIPMNYYKPTYFLKVKSEENSNFGYIEYSFDNEHDEYFGENPFKDDWSIEDINMIKSKKIIIGMTDDQVKLSWGKPTDINRTTTSYGTKEQWVYSRKNYDNDYVYFKNGVCTTIQN